MTTDDVLALRPLEHALDPPDELAHVDHVGVELLAEEAPDLGFRLVVEEGESGEVDPVGAAGEPDRDGEVVRLCARALDEEERPAEVGLLPQAVDGLHRRVEGGVRADRLGVDFVGRARAHPRIEEVVLDRSGDEHRGREPHLARAVHHVEDGEAAEAARGDDEVEAFEHASDLEDRAPVAR